MQEAWDETEEGDVLAHPHRSTMTYEVTSVPLLRFHRYIFAVQVLSPEHGAEWSPPSRPLHLLLPEAR
ncbi:unnamed protein product [Effrenium voratum]|nr:unnamed protein product [Effrenium voratum]